MKKKKWSDIFKELFIKKTVTMFIFIIVFTILLVFSLRMNISCTGENFSIEMKNMDKKIPSIKR